MKRLLTEGRQMGRVLRVLLGVALVAGVGGCARQSSVVVEPRPQFGTGEVRIATAADTFMLQVEIAETRQQHLVGLKRRAELPENHGMIFLFRGEQPRSRGFWMYRTQLPLSIAFLDGDGSIRAIRDMEPCRSWLSLRCPSYRPGVSYHSALEVNRGYFERRGIGVGDRVILQRAAPDARDAPEFAAPEP